MFTEKTITSTMNPRTNGGYIVAVYVGHECRVLVYRRDHREAMFTETFYRRLLHRLGDGIDREVVENIPTVFDRIRELPEGHPSRKLVEGRSG